MTVSRAEPTRDRHWLCAQRIRERRRTLGLTQREVAGRLARLGTPTTNRTLSAMENGRGLDLGLLPYLAESLECTVTYLIGLSCNPSSWVPDRLAAHPSTGDGPRLTREARRPGR
jgi:transcriptional regulator with XRE-family HTH domain